MHMTIHKSAEDYLEAMLMLREERGYIRSIDVAEKLGVTKPSVSYATKRLRESGYISADPAGMIVLLEPGLEIAERMYERHKLLTQQIENIYSRINKLENNNSEHTAQLKAIENRVESMDGKLDRIISKMG